MFAIVEFISNHGKKECSLVPVSWLVQKNTKCYWPNLKNESIFMRMVRDNAPYDDSWQLFDVHRLLYTGDEYENTILQMQHFIDYGISADGINYESISRKTLTDGIYKEKHKSDKRNSGKKRRYKRHNKSKSKKRKYYSSSESSSSSSESEDDSSDSSDSDVGNNRKLKNKSQTPVGQTTSITKNVSSAKTSITSNSVNINAVHTLSTPQSCSSSPSTSYLSQQQTFVTNAGNINQLNVDLFQNIFKVLTRIELLLEQNQTKLNQVLQTCHFKETQPLKEPDDFPNLPLNTIEELEALDVLLDTHETHQIYLIQRLAAIGGTSPRLTINNMLKFLMTNELAVLYNWSGKEKKAFKDTSLKKVVFDASHLSLGKGVYSDTDITKAIQDWLKQAKTRLTNRTGKPKECPDTLFIDVNSPHPN